MFVCTSMSVEGCIRTCTHAVEFRGQPQVLFCLSSLPPCLKEGLLISFAWNLPSSLGWLDTESQRLACLSP